MPVLFESPLDLEFAYLQVLRLVNQPDHDMLSEALAYRGIGQSGMNERVQKLEQRLKKILDKPEVSQTDVDELKEQFAYQPFKEDYDILEVDVIDPEKMAETIKEYQELFKEAKSFTEEELKTPLKNHITGWRGKKEECSKSMTVNGKGVRLYCSYYPYCHPKKTKSAKYSGPTPTPDQIKQAGIGELYGK